MLRFFRNYRKILGLNARNLDYVIKKDSQNLDVAQSKLKTKHVLEEAGLPVPETYFVIRNKHEFDNFHWGLPKSFVLKPDRSLGGDGVLVVYGKKKNLPVWIKAGQKRITIEEIKHHIYNVLEGNFSPKEREDTAVIEQRVRLHPLLKPYVYKGGIPDVRVLVYERVPIMAQLRLPTKESEGRSNLHLGAVGVGIDMKTGVTTTAVHHGRFIEKVPGSRLVLSGIHIPEWKEVLHIAALAQKAIKIDFLGIDIALDRDRGPVIFEVNDRPGLAIQLANQAPLRERLTRVEGLKIKSAKRGTALCQELFGGEVEEELEEISGRRVIGIFEPITVFSSKNEKKEIIAKIDTGAYRTSIDKQLAQDLGLETTNRQVCAVSSLGREVRNLVKISFELDGKFIQTEASLTDRGQVSHAIIIGRRDLKDFLLDPSRAKPKFLDKK